MTNDPTTPKEKPSRLAYWAAACPKWGVIVFFCGMLAQCTLQARNGIPLFVALGSLILGPVIGLGLGGFLLFQKPSPTSRKKAWAGICWGIAGLTISGCFVAYVIGLKNSHHDREDRMEVLQVQQIEVQFHKKYPGQPVTLKALLNSHTAEPDALQPFSHQTGAFIPFASADEAIAKTPFILVPGFQQPSRPMTLAVFGDPEFAPFKKRGEVPVAYEDGSTTILSIHDLEQSLKQQTGLTAAQLVRQQRTP